MISKMANSKQKRPLDKFSTKGHLNPPDIDRDMGNVVDGINIEVLRGYVDETIA